jgi:homocitrate synthase NifV
MEQYDRKPPKIIDTTLREGEQTPGVYFDLGVKKQIVDGLVALGVDEIEIGIASREHSDPEALAEYIHNTYPHQAFSLWCRCVETDISHGASLRPDCLSLSIPASDLHLEKKLGKDREWALQQVRVSVEQALVAGVPKVALGLEDASRADIDFVRELARAAEEAGAFRLRLADTVGICTPASIIRLLEEIGELTVELGVHCHNDFGMATANTIAALESGAVWGDVTLLGLGERAGNSRLEEILAFLVMREKTGSYNLAGLPDLSRMVARESGLEISPSRPIIGTNLFSCETGIHLQGIMADPTTYEPFDPEVVGASRTLLIGRQAGRRSVLATLSRLGLPSPDAPTLTCLTQQIRALATSRKRPLEDQEIIDLLNSQA